MSAQCLSLVLSPLRMLFSIYTHKKYKTFVEKFSQSQ